VTRDLAPEIAAFIDQHEATAVEIARGIQARTADVLDTLRGEAFSGPWLRGAGRRRRRVYRLADRGAERVPAADSQAARPTQNSRILDLLQDGRWHTTAEILQQVPCIVHSRVAEINKRGKRIEHRGAGGGAENHSYRLVTLDEAEDPATSVSSSGIAASVPPVLTASVPLQLELQVAA
jgi:hypothetical protein